MNPVFILIIIIFITFIIILYLLRPSSQTLMNMDPPDFSIRTVNHFPELASILNSQSFTLSFFINTNKSSQLVTNNVIAGYIPIVSFVGSWEIDFSGIPDAASNNSSYIQFKDNNASNTDSPYVLVPLPMQKWTYVTIIRNSRRITIYYNESIIFSEVLPRLLYQGSDLQMGNAASYLYGNFSDLSITPSALTIQDVKKAYKSLSDINGMPHSVAPNKLPTFSELFSANYKLPLLSLKAITPPVGSIWELPYA